MLISLNWIKDFTKLPDLNADDLANNFTMTTAEVEEVKTSFEHLNVIKVAQIKSIRKHPEADKLNLVTIDFGGEDKEVVCGASNVKEGLKIPYAPLGVTLPNGLTLEPKKIRGVLSEGMLCSADELGQGEPSNGLLELKDDAPIGQTMLDYFELEADVILDVDNKSLTHRPDLWGHYGLAREFAACYENELVDRFDKKWEAKLEQNFNDQKAPLSVKVSRDSSCMAYFGLSVDNVNVTNTPSYIINRLEAVGLRSINSIVDISNYVMLELGIPLHIFDRDKISGDEIIIKNAQDGESFTTLDEVQRKLIATDTMITDQEKSLVLAGVMGGQNSGVDEQTKNIFIEVANFKADRVRKTSTRLGLRTDSSSRYEKSLDSQLLYRTLLRTLELVLEICPKAKVVGTFQYDGKDLSDHQNLVVETSVQKIATRLGYDLSEDKCLSLFKALDFGVEKNGDVIRLTIPSYRTTKDIENEADVIEEIGRMIGYDNIMPVSPLSVIQTTHLSAAKKLERKIHDYMTLQARSLEVMTYPLVGKSLLDKAKWDNKNEALVLVNALSKDADRMRPSMIPHALQTASVNAKNYDSFSFFEFGRSYLSCDKDFSKENKQVLIGFYSKKESVFLKTLNTTKGLLKYLGISYDVNEKNPKFKNAIIPDDWSGNHPHEYLNLRIQGKFHGALTSVHPLLLRNFKMKGYLSIAVIDLSSFIDRELKPKSNYKPISKYPSSSFDCTVLVPRDVFAAKALESLKKLKIKELSSKKIVDVFKLNDEHNAVTIRTIFEDANKTLSAEFIKESENKIVDHLELNGFSLKK